MKKRIVGVTGCRSEYDIIYPVLKLLREEKAFSVSLVVAGTHLSERFGYTVRDIERDGFAIADRIHSLIDSDEKIGKIKSSAILMAGLSESLARLDPDFVLVAGDREEAVISGVVCVYLGIPLIHLCGGDRTAPKEGDVDEQIRHATSKLASLHFTMNDAHRKRILKMGEEPWRVFSVGDPALDRFSEVKKMSRPAVLKYFGFKPADFNRPLIFVLQHVISGEASKGGAHMKRLLDAVSGLEANCIINYPNSDMGSRAIIRTIDEYMAKLPGIRVTKNIPRREFVNMLRNLDLLVGNSSMALLEGAFLGIPAINVGSRNRERMNGGNVIFVKPETAVIRRTAAMILNDKVLRRRLRDCDSVYGDGNAAKRIVKILKRLRKTRAELITKNMAY